MTMRLIPTGNETSKVSAVGLDDVNGASGKSTCALLSVAFDMVPVHTGLPMLNKDNWCGVISMLIGQ